MEPKEKENPLEKIREELSSRGVEIGADVPLEAFIEKPLPPQTPPNIPEQSQTQQEIPRNAKESVPEPIIDIDKLNMFMRLKMESNPYIEMVFGGITMSISDATMLDASVVEKFKEAYRLVYNYNLALTLLGLEDTRGTALALLNNIGYK